MLNLHSKYVKSSSSAAAHLAACRLYRLLARNWCIVVCEDGAFIVRLASCIENTA
jgi:hypothetical protein